jgi:pimeloyl-ACP methyl ester carboxylesterase
MGLRETLSLARERQPLDALTEARLARQDEASLLAALDGELQTSHPFASEDQLRQISVPALVVPGLDDAHDPLIAEMYERCLQGAVSVVGSPMEPLGDPAKVRAFLDGSLRESDSV